MSSNSIAITAPHSIPTVEMAAVVAATSAVFLLLFYFFSVIPDSKNGSNVTGVLEGG